MFERYGGFSAVSRIVSSFYNKVMESDRLADYFAGIDMKNLLDHQTKFIASLMGGPASYTNDKLVRAHAHLNIDEESFDEVASLLKETLEDFDLDTSDIDIIMREITERKNAIISKP